MAPRKLIVCCDGTWQKITKTYPTNVAKMKFAIDFAKDKNQVVYYHPGLGTENWFTKLLGGAFGLGLNKDILECYQWLCSIYQPGDGIYLFGFSRGAYTVRSLGGLIYKCGLLKKANRKRDREAMQLYRRSDVHPDDAAAVDFRRKNSVIHPDQSDRPLITLMGCWDTVGSLGIPDLTPKLNWDIEINKPFQFHDTKVSKIIKNARHAVGIDERRKVFNVTTMEQSEGAIIAGNTLKQLWFAGDHGCIGGGDKTKDPLSDCTLHWMMTEATSLLNGDALTLDPAKVPSMKSLKYDAPFVQDMSYSTTGFKDRTPPKSFDDLSWAVKARLKKDVSYNPPSLRSQFQSAIAAYLPDDNQSGIA